MYKKFLWFFLCVSFIKADFLDETLNGCEGNFDCAEQAIIKTIDEYDSKPTVSFLQDFVVLEKTNEVQLTPKSQEGVFERVLRYFMNHEIRIKFPSTELEARELIVEARKTKLRKILLPILLLLKFKTLILIPAALFALALVAFKGLGAGFSALLISGAVALRSFLSHPSSSSSTYTYEVVPQPVAPHWSRAGDTGHEGWNAIIPGYQVAAKPV
ncbi:uncharacterized protein LOC108734499 [Agrilus planipennis]|uniref:Uncharacterized protein LOC108734499 n=1 Tax=Agrilus planipennis TaxID=224129 RepID=A0A1W4WC83_AGRPL|nr:uncharacterized protein LOC108734499 [Agrilus planipennis]